MFTYQLLAALDNLVADKPEDYSSTPEVEQVIELSRWQDDGGQDSVQAI